MNAALMMSVIWLINLLCGVNGERKRKEAFVVAGAKAMRREASRGRGRGSTRS